MGADQYSRRNRLIKLVKDKAIDCGYCKPHRGDNYGRMTWERKRKLQRTKVKGWEHWDPFEYKQRTKPKRLK